METAVKKLYEAMFLVDSAQASDWDALVKTIENILKRSGAEIVAIRNWAERKLAYEIEQKSRGTYVLCFFRTDGSTIPKIENDVQLSDKILRVLILSTEARDEKDIEKDMHGTPDEKQAAVEDKEEDISSPQEAGEDDDTESFEEPEVDEVQQSVTPEIPDAIEPQLPPEIEPTDAIESQPPPEIEPTDAIESQPPPDIGPTDAIESQPSPDIGPADAIEPLPTETEKDEMEKDAAD